VSPRLREQVFARDGHRCQIPGCRSSRNLEIHHIIEQALGGPHEMWNLTTLCCGHHAARHEDLLEITGRAPALKVKWLVPSDSPEEDEIMRKALLERDIDQILYGTRRVPRVASITNAVDVATSSSIPAIGTAVTDTVDAAASTHGTAMTNMVDAVDATTSTDGTAMTNMVDAVDATTSTDGTAKRGRPQHRRMAAMTNSDAATSTDGTASRPAIERRDDVPRGT
jgi:hypothetical protein